MIFKKHIVLAYVFIIISIIVTCESIPGKCLESSQRASGSLDDI